MKFFTQSSRFITTVGYFFISILPRILNLCGWNPKTELANHFYKITYKNVNNWIHPNIPSQWYNNVFCYHNNILAVKLSETVFLLKIRIKKLYNQWSKTSRDGISASRFASQNVASSRQWRYATHWARRMEIGNEASKSEKHNDVAEGKHFMKVYLIIECWLSLNVWIMQCDIVVSGIVLFNLWSGPFVSLFRILKISSVKSKGT